MKTPWTLTAAWALAAVTLLASAVGLWALQDGGEARVGPVVLMRMAPGYDQKAHELIFNRPNPPRADLALTAELSRKAVAQSPEDLGAWLRLVYADSRLNGALTAQDAAELGRSYDLIAIDPESGLFRIWLTLENAQAAPPALLNQVHAEVDALWLQPDRASQLKGMPSQISNPAGRLTLMLWLIPLEEAVAH